MPRVTPRHVRRLKTFVGAVALAAGAALVIAPAASATTAPFPAGTHTITVSGTAADGSARTVQSGSITVTAILPATGSDTGPLTLIGVALIGAGAVILAPQRSVRSSRRG